MNKGSKTAQRVETNCPHAYAENRRRSTTREGGNIAGNARKALEDKTGTTVVSSENFLNPYQK